MRFYQPTIALFLCANFVLAQSSFIPQDIGPGVNSLYDEINPVASADGKTLFFTRVNHPENTFGDKDSEDIWVSHRSNDTWSPAVRLPQLNAGRYNAALGISEDGRTLLLNGTYNKKGNIWKKRGLSVSIKGDHWGTPVKLTVKKLSGKNRGLNSSASMSPDGNYLALSFSTTYNSNKTDLFISEKKSKNNKWRRPVRMRKLNTRFNEDAPFFSADNNTIYFASDRAMKGKFDIYKSSRINAKSKAWTEPVRLNDTINSIAWDSYFKTNSKGDMAYFSSGRLPENGADIFKVKLFEENPFVLVSGKVRNANSDRLLTGKQTTILVNGVPASDTTVNRDSATYSLRLPLGQTHVISVNITDFKSIPDTVDLRDRHEFHTMERDLKAIPLPYVLIKGKMLVGITKEIIPSTAHPRIVLDGVTVDSAVIDFEEGTYELKVNYGQRHSLQVNADHFESLPSMVNLETIDEYQVLVTDLEVDTEKMAFVSGRIIDRKTGKTLKDPGNVKIRVEGPENMYASVDSTGKYELRLALGRSYIIHALAPNYFPVSEGIETVKGKANVLISKDLVIQPIEVGESVRLNNIFFETGKAKLKAESFPELDRASGFLADNVEIKIEIGGHTDNIGKPSTNQILSEMRAGTVANYFISKGISKDRIVVKGYGMKNPIASNKTEEGRSENRRVAFTVLAK
jgi:outer membrane protein OmpA-like peptidoglycan-associated protein